MSAELQSENEELLQFLYACPIGLVALDAAGAITMLNPLAMQLILQLPRSNDVQNLFNAFRPYALDLQTLVDDFTGDRGPICENMQVFVERPEPSRAKKGIGRSPDLVIACTLLKLGPDRFIATLSDVSVQVHQERRLKQAEAWFSSLINGAEDFATLSLDADGFISHVSGSVGRQTGFAGHDLLGQGLDIFDAPDPGSSTLSTAEQIARATGDGWHLNEGWCARQDGSRQWHQRLISVCREDGGSEDRSIAGFSVVMRAVKRQDADTGMLKRRLDTDYLTGLCNRAHFFEIAEQHAIRSKTSDVTAAVIMFDIDHFKQVNDGFGHAIGDAMLKAASAACKTALRPSDTLARLGGEEFVVLMPAADLQQAAETAERLRQAVAAMRLDTPSGIIGVTASFGCAMLDARSPDFASVLASADAALYAAKRDGRDRVALASAKDIAA